MPMERRHTQFKALTRVQYLDTKLNSMYGLHRCALATMCCCCSGHMGNAHTTDSPLRPTTIFELTSPTFASGDQLPLEVTCNGVGREPTFWWAGVPERTKSMAFIVDDVDSSEHSTHWVVAGVSPLALRVGPQCDVHHTEIDTSTWQTKDDCLPQTNPEFRRWNGINDWGEVGWHSPCPASGNHHYVIMAMALDKLVGWPKISKAELLTVSEGHVLARASMDAFYEATVIKD